MTDKKIIIDDVPVQDCCYFDYENDGYKDSCYIHQNECSAQNCYYKQLKRKEQECERLKSDYFTVIKQRNKAEQTLTEIKEIIHFNKTNRLSGGACISIEQILQKISEVENE